MNDMIKLSTQAYWNKRPCNSLHSKEPTDSLLYSRQVSWRKYTVEPHILTFADHKAWCEKMVLDLGCGIGTDSLQFAYCGARVTAVDFSQQSLDILHQRARAENQTGRILALQQDIEDLHMLDANKFDLVYSFGVLHHTPDPVAALTQAHRVAKPGAELRFMVYHRYSWKALWILATYGKFQFWKWGELIQRYSEAQTGSPLTRTYTRRGVKALALAAGWTVTKTQVAHIFPYNIVDYKLGRLTKEWYWRLLPKPVFVLLERLLGWHLLVWARRVE